MSQKTTTTQYVSGWCAPSDQYSSSSHAMCAGQYAGTHCHCVVCKHPVQEVAKPPDEE